MGIGIGIIGIGTCANALLSAREGWGAGWSMPRLSLTHLRLHHSH